MILNIQEDLVLYPDKVVFREIVCANYQWADVSSKLTAGSNIYTPKKLHNDTVTKCQAMRHVKRA